MTSSASQKNRHGFTLIEMLVVIAIIAILILLTATFVRRGVDSANRTRCASNLRQCGIYLFAHAVENRGNLPLGNTSGDGYPDKYSPEFIKAMLANDVDFSVWNCPAVKAPPLNSTENSVNHVRGTYQYFPHLLGAKSVSDLNSNTLLMQDLIYTFGGEWRSNHSKGGTLRRDAISGNPSFSTYFGGTPEGLNILFGDGRVQWSLWRENMEGFKWVLNAGSSRIPSVEGVKTDFD